MNKIIIGIAIRVFIIAAMICIKPIMEESEQVLSSQKNLTHEKVSINAV